MERDWLSERARRKLGEVFPDPTDLAKAESLLAECLAVPLGHAPERLALALLKLSEGDLAKLRDAIASMQRDPRDALAYAEFQNEMRLGPNADAEQLAVARRRDREQYQRWLASKHPSELTMTPKRKAELGLHVDAVVAVRKILWEQWDPIGVNNEPGAYGEYDGYAGRLVSRVVSGGTDGDLAEQLGQVETMSMGLSLSPVEHRLAVARSIREALAALGCV